MDIRLINRSRVPVPFLAMLGGKFAVGELLYPGVARWIKMATPDPTDLLVIGKKSVAAPVDPEELKVYQTWRTGIDVMLGRTDTLGGLQTPDVTVEVWNNGPSIDVAGATPAKIVKGEYATFVAAAGSITLNESATQP